MTSFYEVNGRSAFTAAHQGVSYVLDAEGAALLNDHFRSLDDHTALLQEGSEIQIAQVLTESLAKIVDKHGCCMEITHMADILLPVEG